MSKKGKQKLTEAQKAERKAEKHNRMIQFTPKRMEKYLKACAQVARVASYPLEETEKADILKAVEAGYQEIKEAFEGMKKKSVVFKFSS